MNDLENRFNEFEDETNRNLTMLLGQTWKHSERLQSLKKQQTERFDKLDDRVTAAHQELGELHLKIDEIAKTQKDMYELLKKMATNGL